MFGLSRKRKNAGGGKSDLGCSLEHNIALLRQTFANDETLVVREFQNRRMKAARCCVIYVDGMVNAELISKYVIEPVLRPDMMKGLDRYNLLDEMSKKVLVSNSVTVETEISKMAGAVLYGDSLFLLEGYNHALILNSKGWQTRSISEPESAKVVRGPREGFTESIMMNLSMLRRKIVNADLKFKFRDLGERTHTKTCICYIEGLANESVLQELERRLDEIKIDGIIDSGYIQELIKDAPFSPFETVGANERPDITAAKLLEGRVALFVDGSPFVLTVPFVVVENFQANEDYYNNFILASINRLFRGFTAVITIAIPALFLAIVTFHQEMLPTSLLLSLVASRKDVPIPTVVSLFVMLLIFDIIREATTRMPVHINQAISIIGTIILGQAAVTARLVSAPVLIVTALTGIATLINMNFLSAAIIFRYVLLLGAFFLGIYGLLLCLLLMYLHLMGLRSFGVPYMMNVTKAFNHDGQDAWIRAPWWTMTLRPKIIGARNLQRQSPKGPRQ